MRLRGLAVIATTLTACAAVTGLGDYEIAPADLPPATADGSSPGSTSGVDGASPIPDSSTIDAPLVADAAPEDAGPTIEEPDATTPDAGTDAGPPSPTSSLTCQGAMICSGSLCCVNFSISSGYSGKCEGNGAACDFPYACDSDSDCGAGMKCCVKVQTNSNYAIASSCRSDCGSLKTTCQSKADCSGPGTSCVKGGYQDVIQNLRYCR